MNRPLEVLQLGPCDYRSAWERQHSLARGKYAASSADTLLLVEHPPVITLGRRADRQHILVNEAALAEHGVECIPVDRGGDVTYHGPGQLVAYPIIDLKAHRQDIGWLLRGLEQAVIDCLAIWNIPAFRDPPYTGVWTRRGKIAAIGIAVSHWVSYHGLSLNVCPNLGHFSWITPCGIADRPVTSMAEFLGDGTPDIWSVAERLTQALAAIFGCTPTTTGRTAKGAHE